MKSVSISPQRPHCVNEPLNNGPSYEECACFNKILIVSLQGLPGLLPLLTVQPTSCKDKQ